VRARDSQLRPGGLCAGGEPDQRELHHGRPGGDADAGGGLDPGLRRVTTGALAEATALVGISSFMDQIKELLRPAEALPAQHPLTPGSRNPARRVSHPEYPQKHKLPNHKTSAYLRWDNTTFSSCAAASL